MHRGPICVISYEECSAMHSAREGAVAASVREFGILVRSVRVELLRNCYMFAVPQTEVQPCSAILHRPVYESFFCVSGCAVQKRMKTDEPIRCDAALLSNYFLH